MTSYLEFEKPIAALDAQIAELQQTASKSNVDVGAEVDKLTEKSQRMLAETYRNLTPWQKTLVARHANRPHFVDIVAQLFDDFLPLGGDRTYGEDRAIIGGFARRGEQRFVVIGHEKGHDTETRLRHNFGMGKPEGYRKAIRLMDLADRFGLPVITLVDTSGAFPGVQAEERGQAEAIARATEKCLSIGVPFVTVIVGEGGSGGAVALATADRVMMLEHAVYSVISPEGCASILWRTGAKADVAADAMKVTAKDLKLLGVIDRIIVEPVGGAHRDPESAIDSLGEAIWQELDSLRGESPAALRAGRRTKFLQLGMV
jgi:acetyl-CoA carboxylase carboxyl transferase subunit alpha